MTRIATALALSLAAAPALAHTGAHLHPHTDGTVPLLLGLAVIAAAAALLWRAR